MNPVRSNAHSALCMLACAFALSAAGCAKAVDPPGNGQSHWLRPCESDADCGDLGCECGVCTVVCASDAICSAKAGLSCRSAARLASADACDEDPSETLLCLDDELAPEPDASQPDADVRTMAGEGGTGDAAVCINDGEIEETCPYLVGPFEGACAPRGECCHRSSNSMKIAALGPDDPMVLEYHVTSSMPTNHPYSFYYGAIMGGESFVAGACQGERCWLLWRFTQPRMAGEPVAGPGTFETGVGRYNCDGTYSYYDDTVAPIRAAEELTDPARWHAVEAKPMVDPGQEGVARQKIAWATNPHRDVTTSPFFLRGTAILDWELRSSGFELLELDTSEAGRDCQGDWDGDLSRWMNLRRYQTFAPLAGNDKDIINAVSQTFCQMLSFGVLPPEMRMQSCLEVPRCRPGTEGCAWVKLPDSLCPENDMQRDIFGCHLGALGNPNAEDDYPSDDAIHCTMTEPTTGLDPDLDPNVSKGQCCDPLGAGTDGLPACNAFRMVYEFTAAAAEITDDPKGTFPPVCE